MAKILLAEDDAPIAKMLTLRLMMRDHQIEHVVNGQLAVEKALTGNFDIILMDMHMPVMDGHAATKKLREEGYQNLIVAVTASVMSSDSEKAIGSGCDDCISKPVGADFEDRVEVLIAKAKNR